jgi:nucleoside 2-deoxyribosyltransferase
MTGRHVYIAAPWTEREAAKQAASLLEAAGYTVTEPWWEHPVVDVEHLSDHTEELRNQASKDWQGVRRADALLLLNLKASEGKAVEQGLALAAGIPIVAVGQPGVPYPNVFHFLPHYYWVGSVEEALVTLDKVLGVERRAA